MDIEDRLAERAGDREDRYFQTITKARNTAEQADDMEKLKSLMKCMMK